MSAELHPASISSTGVQSGSALIQLAAAGTATLGCIALSGWFLDLPELKSVFPGAVEMKPNTAVGLIASGAALWCLSGAHARIYGNLGRALALLVSALGWLTLAQYLFGLNFYIDEFLFADTRGSFNAVKGRMSPYTAAALGCIGAAMALPAGRQATRGAYAGAALTFLTGMATVIGYAWNASELTTDVFLPPVALNTAVAFVVLGAGTFLWIRRRERRPSVNNFPRLGSVEKSFLIGFGMSFLLLVTGGGVSYQAGADFSSAIQGVTRTQRVLANLSAVEAHLSAATVAQRNYLITGQPQLIEDYRAALSSYAKASERLAGLTRDEPAVRGDMEALQALTDRLQTFLDDGVRLYQTGGFPAAQQFITQAIGLGSLPLPAAVSIIRRMELAELQLLHDQEQLTLSAQRQMLVWMLVTVLAATFVFGLLFISVRQQMRARAHADEGVSQARLKSEQARSEADAANRAKSSFLAAMSHEIRTPMNGVLGLLELLSLTKLDADQRSTLKVTRESSRSLLRLVDDILDFSKIEANKLEIRAEPASVHQLVDRVCDLFRGTASSKGLVLVSSVDPAVGPAHLFDAQRLEQVLNNLVSNAIKFTERGSVELHVRLLHKDEAGESLEFRVTDTGIGIALEKIANLFQPFVQGDSDIASRFGGTGLGLVISRRIAELMGGTAEIESKLGAGTTMSVTVSFPAAVRSVSAPEPAKAEKIALQFLEGRRSPPTIEEAEAEGTLILVVDDHPTNRLVLSRQLTLLGYANETAADGLQALEALKRNRFGAVITDCNMPEMSGYDLARKIRLSEASEKTQRIPILACTANALQSEAAACTEAGMDDYLVKPVTLSELARRIDFWVPLSTVSVDPRVVDSKAAPLIDHSLLDAITAGDVRERESLLAEFRRLNDVDSDELLAQLSGDLELDKITHHAHRIHGSCAMLGASALAEICREIEAASRAKQTVGWHALTEGFKREKNRLDRYLRELATMSVSRM